jgi:hypothetical protein
MEKTKMVATTDWERKERKSSVYYLRELFYLTLDEGMND